ncbi:DUF4349 domain-containing protein [Streptomyces sp. NBC_00257]|uniref:DUF4349 domain-containing protein n=1 Tax=unclassified Streptomyces TaxID=2593676 RepID=UPI0022539660|nr:MULTISPECIES: DUF4349 domain-containing protein [unclassified Streptomyces]WTB57493.1 DUF4349 domain-containing protein [Streptomyces sp. NBC_00826]WTH89625.1 DUF4349 domain-containing protein [Streptomyces sp. NBC_00825]WTH98352.1 DUF4349 domain-containing protein [Streptomyces sp. NBC_00822]MCX4863714.1 DUF4349 domain-containing protein [Streptomyces sp. NBC_00906]MCX4894952.1 DUF4349 domain-containing protein [Streptomyces sp. NBC_00892]
MQRHRHPGRSSVRRPHPVLAAGLVAGLLALSGCAASDSASDASSGDSKRAFGAEERGAADAAAGKAEQGTAGSPSQRKKTDALPSGTHVIRTAALSVEVRNVPKAAAVARSAAEGSGGLVADEKTERVDDTHDMSHLVLRVPQGEYEAVLKRLAGTGKLLSRTSSAKDVTDQVVDVESRIATQRASVARVRKLMDQAEKLSDVVTLEGELSSRQASLESLLAQQSSLKDRTTLATITLELTEPETAAKDGDDGPGFLDALGGGWHAFVTALLWLAMAVGAAAPFLAAAAVLLLLWRLLRRRLPGRRAPRAPGPGGSSPAPPAS